MIPNQEPHRVTSENLGLLTAKPPIRIVHDAWRGRDRIFRYTGACIVCNRKTWAFDDGENDPRGMLDDHALWTTTGTTRDGVEIELRTCSVCANDYGRYKLALALALADDPARLVPIRYTIDVVVDENREPTYKIVRHRLHGNNVVVERGLTLDQAQAHCRREDTHGDGWFDGYDQE